MKVEQLYTSCLSEAAYYVESNGEVAIIDPLRDVDVYIEKAAAAGAKIKYIFETHFHADFVSGHVELAGKTGATIVYGPDTEAKFDFHKATDGEEFKVGALTIKAIHTPGHTLESTCYLLHEENNKPYCIFTGDTLFVGDVGRPDLFSGNLSKEELAGMMYDSLHGKLKQLPDEVILYPAHGPGSSCGKALGPETFSTMGAQKANNYALQEQTKEEFIEAVTTGLNTPPPYFPVNARINKEGYTGMDEIKEKGLQALSIAGFKEAVEAGAWIIDTRPATKFTEGFVPESISIGLDGRYAEWAGTLIPNQQMIVLVTDNGKEEESVVRLSRVGLDGSVGYLKGGFEAWRDAGERTDMIVDIEADELAMDIPFDNHLEVLDVRKPGEYEAGHVQGATNLPLSEMMDPFNLANVDAESNLYVHCAGGYRSVIACSILKKQGFHNLRNILGGWSKMKDQEGVPVVYPDKKSAA